MIGRALTAAGIPDRVRGGGLLARPEVADALAALRRLTARPESLRIWRVDLDDRITEASDPARLPLELFRDLAGEFATLDPSGDAAGFLDWLDTATRDEAETGGDVVEIATFHRAKGLEWPVVVVAGLEDGLVPIAYAHGDEAASGEERRLLYVALSRASTELSVTWAGERRFGDRVATRQPSPFLAGIELAAQEVAEGHARARRQRPRGGTTSPKGAAASQSSARRGPCGFASFKTSAATWLRSRMR